MKFKQTVVWFSALAAAVLLTGIITFAETVKNEDGESAVSYAITGVSALTVEAGETVLLTPSVTASALSASSVDDMTAADIYNLASDQGRSQDSGHVYIGIAVENGTLDTANSNWADRYSAGEVITLNDYVEGEGFTAVYANNSSVEITGILELDSNGTGGVYASDFSGVGVAVVAGSGSDVTITDASVTTDGFVRSAAIAYSADLTILNSTVLCLGDNPLTEAYDGYYNSSDTNAMLSPPWVLGIQGGVRAVNVLGDYSSVYIENSSITSGGWAVVSSDGCSYPAIVIADSEMSILPASDEDGMDSGWAILGYSGDKYGSGYGIYCIGGAHEYFYGTSITGTTYAAIVRSGDVHYASSDEYTVYEAGNSNSSDAAAAETKEGEGNACTISSVFGWLFHSSEDASVELADGTSVSAENAVFLFKGSSTVNITVDNSSLYSAEGIILQMMDDDDETVGADSSTKGFNATLDEASALPSENGNVSESSGGEVVNITLSNGTYEGDLYNGTGYYGQGGDTLAVTISDGASLTGDISLTQTIHGIEYSESAVSAIEALDGEVSYELMDADGNVTDDAAQAAYIHFTSFTINQYYLLGHMLNFNYYNGTSQLQVTVNEGGTWTVAEECIVTCLVVENGAVVYGTLTDNGDGTYTLTSSDETVASGTYGTEVSTVGSSGEDELSGGMQDSGDMPDMGSDMPDGGSIPDTGTDMPDGGSMSDMGADGPDMQDGNDPGMMYENGDSGAVGQSRTLPDPAQSGAAVSLLSLSAAANESSELSDVTFTFESSDPDTASVDEGGTVTGISAGSAKITIEAYSGDTLLASAKITVTVTGDAAADGSAGTSYAPWIAFIILITFEIVTAAMIIFVYLTVTQKKK